MPGPSIPAVARELFADRRALSALLAGSATLFAAGLDPKVLSPTLTTVQAAIRERPGLEALVLVVAVLTALMLLVGGAIGDLSRARPLVIGGLGVLLAAAVVGLLVSSGPVFTAARVAAAAATGLLIPVGLASVATANRGVARATAIGVAYAAYGGASALMPVLLTLIPGAYWPGFVAGIAATTVALWVTWRRVPDLQRPNRAERPHVLGTALWAGSVVSFTAGLLWLGGGWDNPVRLAIMALGVVLLVAFLTWEWRRRIERPESVRIDRRPVTVALFVGVVIAIAQTVPMVQLPLYFWIVAGYGPLFGIVAVAPLFLALVAAGPVAGFLLARFAPRTLVAGGVAAVGAGNLALAAVIGRETAYLVHVVPLVLIGAGFVIATTVRTAVIFASVPRGLPATAAALNEASIQVGMRVGIVLVSAIVAERAMAALEPSLAGMAAGAAADARQQFGDLLTAVGTPSFKAIAGAVPAIDVDIYREAYVTGIQSALFLGGVAAVLGGVVAWLGLGRGDPISARGTDPMASVYALRDERAAEGHSR